MIRGVPNRRREGDDDEEEDSDDYEDSDENSDDKLSEEEKARYTDADMEHMRWILVTRQREKFLDGWNDSILGDQAGDSILMFNTRFSYHVMDVFSALVLVLKQLDPAATFDALLGFSQGPRCRGVEVFQLGLLGNALKFV